MGKTETRLLAKLTEKQAPFSVFGSRETNAARKLHAAGVAEFRNSSEMVYVRKGTGRNQYYGVVFAAQGSLRPIN